MLYCPLISFPHALILWPMSYWIKASSVYSLLFTLVHSFIHSFILFFLSCVFLYLCSHVSYGVWFLRLKDNIWKLFFYHMGSGD